MKAAINDKDDEMRRWIELVLNFEGERWSLIRLERDSSPMRPTPRMALEP
jgi:hypothetical protein